MERKRKQQSGAGFGEVEYRKIGKGSHRMGKRIIKPGQVFTARPGDISASLLSGVGAVFEVVSGPAEVKEAESTLISATGFEVRASESPGWYNVVNKETGNAMNDKKLRQADAQKLHEELS